MELLDKNTPQFDFDNIYALILVRMSTNKELHVKVNGYGGIASNDETANNSYIVYFTSAPYTL